MGKKETLAQLKLAEAMTDLAEKIKDAMNPELWRRILNEGVRQIPSLAQQVQVPLPIGIEGPVPVRAMDISVTLSDEEREHMVEKLFEALKPQLTEFQAFVKQSIGEMSTFKIQEASKLLDEGKVPVLKRRRGCIFMCFEEGKFDDDIMHLTRLERYGNEGRLTDFYLGL